MVEFFNDGGLSENAERRRRRFAGEMQGAPATENRDEEASCDFCGKLPTADAEPEQE